MSRILLLENQPAALKPYADILAATEGVEVLCQAALGRGVLCAATMHPDIVLLDTEADAQESYLQLCRDLLSLEPPPKTVLLTVSCGEEALFQAFLLGVSGYLPKSAPPEDVVACIRVLENGLYYLSPAAARQIREGYHHIRQEEFLRLRCIYILRQLTSSELDVLKLTAQGYTRQQICSLRCVELSTVKSQIRSILKKFGKKNMQELLDMLNSLHALEPDSDRDPKP